LGAARKLLANRLAPRRKRGWYTPLLASFKEDSEMRQFDLSPLYRSTIGFDRLFNMIDQAAGLETMPSYPPYNIERTGENAYRISVAVAGFGRNRSLDRN
jgi:hypothetical protein